MATTLVMAVCALVTIIAATFMVAAWRRRVSFEITVLAIGSALGLTAIDVMYRHVALPIYLVDLVAEVTLAFAWAAGLYRQSYILAMAQTQFANAHPPNLLHLDRKRNRAETITRLQS